MNTENLKNIINDIVAQANKVRQTIVTDSVPVNYACIFCQNDEEYISFLELARQMGKIVQDTKAGPVFQIEPLPTIAGVLHLLKIRKPDPFRPERGDADFTLPNYNEFKQNHINQEGYKIIDKSNFEMIEYKSPDSNVLIYFSNPTLGEVLGIK